MRLWMKTCFALGVATSAMAQPALVTKKGTNLRPDPSTRFQAFTELPKDTNLILLEPAPEQGYFHVMTNDAQEGWVWKSNVSTPTIPAAGAAPPTSPAGLAHPIGGFPECMGVTKLPDCSQETGCATAGTSKARLNGRKNTLPNTGGSPATMKHSIFKTLQAAVDTDPPVPTGRFSIVTEHVRNTRLKNISATGGPYSEGDFVQLAGFIPRFKKPGPQGKARVLAFAGAESVNCNLADPTENDIHIPIVSGKTKASHHEHTSVTVEPIPHGRPADWTLEAFQHVQAKQFKVLVRGQLMYDNSHTPNPDPESTSSDPKRISSWEIHPVTAFLVCTKPASQCDPDEASVWTALEDLEIPED